MDFRILKNQQNYKRKEIQGNIVYLESKKNTDDAIALFSNKMRRK